MALQVNLCIPWPGTAASIPSGWLRETRLDTKHVRGAAAGQDADLNTAFGSLTHTHTESGSHTPIQNSHTHDVSAGVSTGSTTYNTGGSNALAADSHSHMSATSDPTTGLNNSSTITVATANNDPPFRKVIWIKSDGTPTGVPNNGYAFYDSDSTPSGWARFEGNNYLKGADALGDGTGTGGSSTHTHTESGAHIHTQQAHSHTGTSNVNDVQVIGGGTGLAAGDGHHHTYTLDNATPTNNASSVSFGSASLEPVFKKLNILKNQSGADALFDGMIMLYLGTNASIPTDFTRFTAMDDFFLKGANADGEVLTTGGASSHTHTATCSTTSPSHNHSSTVATSDLSLGKGTGTSGVATIAHTHTWSVTQATITHQSVAITINNNTAESHYPLYQKAIFVKYSPVAPPTIVPSYVDSTSVVKRDTASFNKRVLQSKTFRANLSRPKQKDLNIKSIRKNISGGERQR